MKKIKKQIKEFIKDSSKKRLELDVPQGFSPWSVTNPIGVILRKTVLGVLTKVPPMRIKNLIVKLIGYDFGEDVCMPGYIHIDPFFPKLIKIEKGVLIGGLSSIISWEINKKKLVLGKIHIKERALLAGYSRIRAGAVINENTITGIRCLIDKEIPKDSFVIKHNTVVKTWSKEEVERHFGKSNHDPDYRKKVRELTKKFRKDKSLRSIRFRNNGSRLNAGCDWFLARPVWNIYLNGAFIELALLCPFEPVRKLLYWLSGVRWGKNFHVGRRVTFDHIYGSEIRLGDNVTIEDDVFMDAHEYTISETVYARTIVRDNVTIKKGSWVRGGVTLESGVTIEPDSDVLKDVGANETWSGSPAKKVEE